MRRPPREGFLTCVTLTPFRDSETNVLYLQANTIIPVPGAEDYAISIGNGAKSGSGVRHGHSFK